MKLDYKKTFLIGLGFFTVSIIWSMYNLTVPDYLDDLNMSKLLTGVIMALDNMFAAIFNPFFGNMSDKTRSKRGKRLPFLFIGIPLSTLFFLFIPFARFNIYLLIPIVMCMNFCMCIYRSPAVSLMPDLTLPINRTKANGVINLVGGLGIAISMMVGMMLFGQGEVLPFIVCSVLTLTSTVVIYFKVHERKSSYEQDEEEKDSATGKLSKGEKKSLILILTGVFCWFSGYNGIETYLTLFCKNVLHVDKSVASSMFLVVSSVFLLMAIPAGFIGNKFGRKRTIMTGLVIMVIACLVVSFTRDMTILYVILALAGTGWALININSYPMVVHLARNRVGTFTGYYYSFSMIASSIAPIVLGALMDIVPRVKFINMIQEEMIFPMAVFYFILALIVMKFVKHGEVDDEVVSVKI